MVAEMPSGPLAFVVASDKSRASTSSSEQRRSGGQSSELAFKNVGCSLVLKGGILLLKHFEKRIDALVELSVFGDCLFWLVSGDWAELEADNKCSLQPGCYMWNPAMVYSGLTVE